MKVLRLSIAVTALCASFTHASAQSFPARPVTIVSPFAAGGSSDTGARIFAEHVGNTLGQRIIVENKTGGSGVVAALAAKAAAPDGYTLLLSNVGPNVVMQQMQTLTYDPIKDFEPVINLFSVPTVLIVPASLGVNSVAELAALAKIKPGGLTYASPGTGTGGHILGTMFQSATGATMTHVPYKGGAPLMIDLVTGRVDMAFQAFPPVKQELSQNRVKVLAVASPRRLPQLPDVPTMAEAGYPGLEFDTWFGLVAPKGAPKDIIAKLNTAFLEASRKPDVMSRFSELDMQIVTGSPEAFATYIDQEAAKFEKVVKDNNLKAE